MTEYRYQIRKSMRNYTHALIVSMVLSLPLSFEEEGRLLLYTLSVQQFEEALPAVESR
jgi:hypothetical protein